MADILRIYRRRDLTMIDMADGNSIVIACDSCGGIGSKPGDALLMPPTIVGRFNARVVLMELLAAGAEVISLCNIFCCEMEPTGAEVLKGIEEELKNAGIDPEIMNGSTEENFITTMTGIGITAIGICKTGLLKFGSCVTGDQLYLIGRPYVGEDVLSHNGELANYEELKSLVEDENVKEIVPVGSKGILYEAHGIGEFNGLQFEPVKNPVVDLTQSGGPATCIIGAVGKSFEPVIGKMHLLGDLVAK